MEIREVAVIGLGTMGAGIAEVFAHAGLAVTAIEMDRAALGRGMAALDASLSRAVARGKLAADGKDQALGRVTAAADLAAAAKAGLVVEVVPERLDIKRHVFAELDRLCRPDAILATNTSSLPVTAIAAGTQRPGRVAGMHFFSPAPVMRLVEVVAAVQTDRATVETVAGLVRALGKTPVTVTDRAGFVANALLLPYLNHAVSLLAAGYATRDDIDTAARVGMGLPMGPLALLDLIGLDTSLAILEVLAGEYGGSRFTPAPLLRRMTETGWTGRKGGRGFYDYGQDSPPEPSDTPPIHLNDSPPPLPPITLIDCAADRTEAVAADALNAMIDAAGVTVTRVHTASGSTAAGSGGNPWPWSGGDLVVVAASPYAAVLAAVMPADRSPDMVGMHVAGGRLAEVISTVVSAPEAAARAAALGRRLGLEVIRCPDRPGFLVGALLYPHLNDAVRMVQDGYASAVDVDTVMTLGCGYPRGPLAMLDDIGAEQAYAVLASMHARYGDPAFAPVPLLADHATARLAFHAAESAQ
jgi:3-hydroxybutyryl-CoA dehydrogenase